MPIPFLGRAADAFGDLVHAPLFGGLTLGVLLLLDQVRPLRNVGNALAIRTALVLVSVVAFATAIEAMQGFLGRTATFHDAIANGLGATAGALCYGSWKLKRNHTAYPLLRHLFLAAAAGLVAIAWWNPLGTLHDVLAVHRDFPLLASFESPRQLERFFFRHSRACLTRQNATDGRFAMEVTYQPRSEPRATLVDFRRDWTAVKTLELDVALDASYSEQNVRLMVKVVDQSHADWGTDTFRRVCVLVPGQPQHIRISRQELIDGPDARKLDLSNIQFVTLYPLHPVGTMMLRVDAIKLTLQLPAGPETL
jgi:hypothetical protein